MAICRVSTQRDRPICADFGVPSQYLAHSSVRLRRFPEKSPRPSRGMSDKWRLSDIPARGANSDSTRGAVDHEVRNSNYWIAGFIDLGSFPASHRHIVGVRRRASSVRAVTTVRNAHEQNTAICSWPTRCRARIDCWACRSHNSELSLLGECKCFYRE